jgi:hypothetical protein
LVEVDSGVGCDVWAWVVKYSVGGAVLVGCDGREMHHGEIAAGHELDGRALPDGGGVLVAIPRDMTRLTCFFYDAWTRDRWDNIRSGNEGGQKGC